MLDALKHRTIIIGNSGSGKSTLATRISEICGCQHVRLDEIYWVDQRCLKKRGQADAQQMALALSQEPQWVIEGVFGWLVELVSPRATMLIWLDLPWSECETGLISRGPVHGTTENEFNDLVAWAHLYWERRTSSSYAAHARIYEAFEGRKLRVGARLEVNALCALIGRNTTVELRRVHSQ